QCDLAEAHLSLFMYDKEFLDLKRELTINIVDLEGIVETSILKIYSLYSKCEIDLENSKDDIERYSEHKNLLSQGLTQLTESHRKDSIEQYKEVHDLHAKMIQLINKRLKQLEEDEKISGSILRIEENPPILKGPANN